MFDTVTSLNCTKNTSEVITNHNRSMSNWRTENVSCNGQKKRNIHSMGSTTLATSSKNMQHQDQSNPTIHQDYFDAVKGIWNYEVSRSVYKKSPSNRHFYIRKKETALLYVKSDKFWVRVASLSFKLFLYLSVLSVEQAYFLYQLLFILINLSNIIHISLSFHFEV